jgi:hypothetical protein
MVLMNLKNQMQRWHQEKITCLWGIDKFHGFPIPNFWVKVIAIVRVVDVALMHPHEVDDQVLMQDVIGTCTLWNHKYLKIV